MRVIVTASAESDLQAAVDYRDRQARDLGAALLRAFNRAVVAIASQPRLYPLVEDEYPGREVREYHVERFSQRILYYHDDQRAVVFAMLHTSRRPGAWHRRLETFQ